MIKAARSYLVRQFNNISIRTKLLVFFFIVSILPLLIITFTNYGIISSETREHTVYVADKMLEQSISILDNKIKSMMDASMSLSIDSAVQKILQKTSPDYFDDTILQQEDYVRLSEFLISYLKYDSISSLMLYVPERFSFADQNTTFYNFDTVKNTGWYEELSHSAGQLNWFETSDITGFPADTVSAFRKIRNLAYLPEVLGLIRIDVDKDLVLNIFDEVLLTPNSKLYISNTKNQVIGTNIDENLSWFSKALTDEKNPGGYNSWDKAELPSGPFLYRTREILNTDWQVTVFIPYSDLLSASDKAKNNILVIALIVSVIAYVLAYLFSRTLTHRIKLLIKYMKKVVQGNFDIEILSQSADEVGQLIQNFNFMLTKMSMLMDEKVSIGKDIKAAELKALQSQINPHFLYNTLDLIQWRAINRSVPEISTLVKSLAKYYKLVLSRGEDTVPLKDEFEHVRIYAAIQNERFHHCLVLETDMDPALADFLLPKLLLQPLVENSLHHGILEKNENGGSVKIKAWQEGESVFITVEDDGVGMTQNTCANILSLPRQNKDNGSSYGVKNIHERILLFYGSEASLRYESTLGVGTKVTIQLPFQ